MQVEVEPPTATAVKKKKHNLHLKKHPSKLNRHRHGNKKKSTYDFTAARAEMGNPTAVPQQLASFIAPYIKSPRDAMAMAWALICFDTSSEGMPSGW